MLLLCSFFRLTELFQVKNGVTTSLLFFFFFENAKNLSWSDDSKRRKKRGWPYLIAWLAQLGERRSVEREVLGSNPSRTNTQKKLLPL